MASFKLKQKISLARTLYSNADIYIINNTLSCFDEENEIFNEIFSPTGILKNKTRIIVTDKVYVLEKCDEIILFDNGYISAVDSFHNLIESSKLFKSIIQKDNNNTALKSSKLLILVVDFLFIFVIKIYKAQSDSEVRINKTSQNNDQLPKKLDFLDEMQLTKKDVDKYIYLFTILCIHF